MRSLYLLALIGFTVGVVLTQSGVAYAEPVPGDSCSGHPAGSVMHAAGPESGGKAYLMSCSGGVWVAAVINPDPCAEASPLVGTKCKDGTIYAGISPDGNTKMFAMSGDGPAGTYRWNNGTSNFIDTALVNCDTPFTESSCRTGRANTSYLAGLSNTDSPYEAAKYCEDLVSLGYSDWYLPAQAELVILYNSLGPAGQNGFINSVYWSSSEQFNGAHGIGVNWNTGVQVMHTKSIGSRVRCVRR